eukprot:616296-Karenia_brevis.AAC.1
MSFGTKNQDRWKSLRWAIQINRGGLESLGDNGHWHNVYVSSEEKIKVDPTRLELPDRNFSEQHAWWKHSIGGHKKCFGGT